MAKAKRVSNAVVRKQVRAQVRVMRTRTDAVRDEDADGVHDLRVASRRLRAILAEHKDLFDNRAVRKVRKRARRVTRALGRPRELDVSIEVALRLRNGLHGPARYAASHLLRQLRTQRDGESSAIAKTADRVDSPKFRKAVKTLLNSGPKPGKLDFGRAARSLRKRYRAVVAAHVAWQQGGTDESLHALRIEFKKLRYTCEIYRGINGGHLDNFIASLKEVQESIGEWHDLCVLRDYASEAAPSAPAKATEGMPLLAEAIEGRRQTLLLEFAAHVEPFFGQDRQSEIEAFFSGLKGI